MYRRTSEMAREEETMGHNKVICDFLQTHDKAKAVDIAERLFSTIHMSVGEVQRYLGDLIDQHHVTLDANGYHTWTHASPRQEVKEQKSDVMRWENERS